MASDPEASTPSASPDAPSEAAEAKRIRRRHVFYFHGFDPASSERYRRLIARAGEAWSASEGARSPAFGPVSAPAACSEGWLMEAGEGETRVETTFEILRYEDVVRQWRGRPKIPALFSGLAALAGFVLGGGLKRCFGLARGPGLLFLYPIFMLLSFVGFGFLAGRSLAAGLAALGAPGWGLAAGLLGAAAGLALSYRVERSFFVHLMLALFEFIIRLARDEPPSGRLRLRVDEFADRMAGIVDGADKAGVDEVLVIGHSLGGVVAISALARAMERSDAMAGEAAPAVGLLTLGSVAGFLACRGGPGAEAWGADAARIARDEAIDWVDVSAPRDWFSFGLVDPLLLLDAPPPDARSPLVISAKFGPFRPDPEDRRTRFRAMALHMRYLGPPDQDGAFDLFPLIAGTERLADRYASRRSSPRARMLGG